VVGDAVRSPRASLVFTHPMGVAFATPRPQTAPEDEPPADRASAPIRDRARPRRPEPPRGVRFARSLATVMVDPSTGSPTCPPSLHRRLQPGSGAGRTLSPRTHGWRSTSRRRPRNGPLRSGCSTHSTGSLFSPSIPAVPMRMPNARNTSHGPRTDCFSPGAARSSS